MDDEPRQSRHRLFIGVDPGRNGGLVAIRSDGGIERQTRMPPTDHDIHHWLPSSRSVFAVIERVHAMPKQGVSSTFRFGVSYGGLRMALVCHDIPFAEVTPAKWQREFVAPRKKSESNTEWKNRLKAASQQLFPRERVTLYVADAILIAEYARRKYS